MTIDWAWAAPSAGSIGAPIEMSSGTLSNWPPSPNSPLTIATRQPDGKDDASRWIASTVAGGSGRRDAAAAPLALAQEQQHADRAHAYPQQDPERAARDLGVDQHAQRRAHDGGGDEHRRHAPRVGPAQLT